MQTLDSIAFPPDQSVLVVLQPAIAEPYCRELGQYSIPSTRMDITDGPNGSTYSRIWAIEDFLPYPLIITSMDHRKLGIIEFAIAANIALRNGSTVALLANEIKGDEFIYGFLRCRFIYEPGNVYAANQHNILTLTRAILSRKFKNAN